MASRCSEDLGKTYGTVAKTVALTGVSFDLQGGEFASIIGQSGSGKSTLLDLIGLLDTPSTGRVAPNGHDTAAADRKKRVAIARALMNQPALVLADEPTGNLDTLNTRAVYKLFRELNRKLGNAFMIVTHDRSVAQQTDRILEVQDGRLLHDVRSSSAESALAGEMEPESEEAPRPPHDARSRPWYPSTSTASSAPGYPRRLPSAVTGGEGSSAGRAPGCGPGGRGFESRPSPHLRDAPAGANAGRRR